MKKQLPDKVTLNEVGPRDGFQFESKIIPTQMKIEIIEGLVQSGVKKIQVTSFVNPKRVPQMADAEKVIQGLSEHKDVIFSGLVLNDQGVERAISSGLKHIEISISASSTHSKKNTGMSFEKAMDQVIGMIQMARGHGMMVRAGVQCAFGCVYEGNIPEEKVVRIIKNFVSLGPDSLVLSDTTGLANPFSIGSVLSQVLPHSGEIPLSLHLHDTRGLGLANLMTALEYGITQFDSALGGMGGCPFIVGAAGNIATEDTVYLLESMHIETGIDIKKVSEMTKKLEAFLSKRFPAKTPHLY